MRVATALLYHARTLSAHCQAIPEVMDSTRKHPEIPVPENMRSLALTGKGYLKPWFVKGDDFRVVDLKKAAFAVTKKACWICGKPFRKAEYAMVCSPESARLLIFKEPPCHPECAEYAMRVCPFILYPQAKRRVANLPAEASLAEVNKKLEIKISDENPGEFYLVKINDFLFDQERQVITCSKSNLIESQHWIGGVRQFSAS